MNEIFETLKALMAEECDVEEELITMDSHMMNDLGLTSMDVFSVVSQLKKTYKIAIPEKALRSFVNVCDIVKYIAEK